jgi:hypothetical protein
VLDQPAREEDVIALVRERRSADLFDVDPVRNDLDVVAVGSDRGEPVGCYYERVEDCCLVCYLRLMSSALRAWRRA